MASASSIIGFILIFIISLTFVIVFSIITDNINKSSCHNSQDDKIKGAYTLGLVTSVVSGILVFLCLILIILTIVKKSKSGQNMGDDSPQFSTPNFDASDFDVSDY